MAGKARARKSKKGKRSAALRKAAGPRKSAPARGSEWTVQEARAHLSQVIDAAMAGRPQRVTRFGKEAIVIVSAREFDALTKPKESLREFFLNSPLSEVFGKSGIPEVRDKERLRDIDLSDLDV
jgi:prevent-host-death family protein